MEEGGGGGISRVVLGVGGVGPGAGVERVSVCGMMSLNLGSWSGVLFDGGRLKSVNTDAIMLSFHVYNEKLVSTCNDLKWTIIMEAEVASSLHHDAQKHGCRYLSLREHVVGGVACEERAGL